MSEGSKNVNEVLRWVDAGRTVQVWDPLHECWTLATHQDRGSVRHWIRAGGAFRVVPGVHGGVPRSDAGDDPTPAEQAADLTQEVERLSAENARLREACFEASLRLHGSLARHRDLDLDLVSYQYVTSASSLLNVALDHSGTLDDQTERWLERAKADAQPGPKHAATDLMAELEASIARVRADRAGRAAPSPSTGEDGGK